MWLKPVKSFSSDLAFQVRDDHEFRSALDEISKGIGRVGAPFQRLLDRVEQPAAVREAGGEACLAEHAVTGSQVTVEGYRTAEETVVYGIIDSHNYPDTSSFHYYRYPSEVPSDVQRRLVDISERVVERIDLRHSAFNIEYFWNEDADEIKLLEVNPRHSQSHAMLFEYVDGTPNHRVMVRLALGLEVEFPHRKGPYAVAAKYFVRRFVGGRVLRVPTDEEVDALERQMSGCAVDVLVEPGQRLADLAEQDSYSYAIASIHLGARDQQELTDKYERCLRSLPFAFDEREEAE
ncbi:ATP-grasp domain-containing protein [Sciscionella sediminilitoris]|uniref:ATP-grasp domain-containing protein n=1 Tax=Sciscionella sediminilitoris TaxID=1445613 RepID=UPI003CCCC23B